MTRLDSVQKSRIRAAAAITRAFAEHRSSDDLGDRLIEAYWSAGKGDEYDIGTTIIDCIADLAFAIGRRGGDFAAIAQHVKSGLSDSIEAEIILTLKQAYRPECRGYSTSLSFEDLLRIAADHNGIEIEDGDAADYRSPRPR